MKQPMSGLVVFFLGLVLATVGTTQAEVVDTQMLLRPLDPHRFQDFGYAVAISGTNAVIGAPESALQPGTAYVYSKFGTNWIFQQKLFPARGMTNDLAGVAVSIDGNLLAIGAPTFTTNPATANFGSVYIFGLTNGVWGQQATLTAPDRQRNDRFGVSVALSGMSVTVGSSFHNDFGATNNGSVYVYDLTRAGWQLSAKIVPTDLTNNSFFGQRVAMSGNTLIAGANSSIIGNTNFFLISPGAAYVYTRTNVTPFFAPWNLQQKLLPNNFTNSGLFGWTVALDGDTALVGAPFTTEGGTVYAFVRNGNIWTNQALLVPGDLTNGDTFGFSVALQGTRAVIGAVDKNSNDVTRLGAAYVFTQTNLFVGTNDIVTTNAFGETNIVGATNTLFETNVAANTNVVAPPMPDTNVLVATNVIAETNFVGETNLLAETNGPTQTNNGWVEQQELRPLQVNDNFEFGFSVDVGAQGILVGAPAAPIGRGTGAAYVFGSSEALLSIVSATASPSILTPPNLRLVPVTITVVTTGSNVTSRIVSITSNQSGIASGSSPAAPNAIITGDLTALLRAQLPANINFDRVYSILVESRDAFGNIVTAPVQVTVPHTVGALQAPVTFNTAPAFNNGSIINFGTINTGIVRPGNMNPPVPIHTGFPVTNNLVTQ